MLVDYWLRASCPSACDIGARVLMRDDTAPAKVSGRQSAVQVVKHACVSQLLFGQWLHARLLMRDVPRADVTEGKYWLYANKQFCPAHKCTHVRAVTWHVPTGWPWRHCSASAEREKSSACMSCMVTVRLLQ